LDLSLSPRISEQDFCTWTRRVLPRPGDVVFSYETRLGQAALIPPGLRCCLGRRMGLLRPDSERIDAHYLLYAFLAPQFQATIRARTIRGSTVDRIQLSELARFPITIHRERAEQQRIAAVLGAVDDKIALDRRIAVKLDEMAQTLFQTWFIDFHGHDDWVKDTPGSIPRGWTRAELGTLLELRYGKALPATQRCPGPVPVYGSAGIVGRHDAALVPGPGVIVGRKGLPGTVYWEADAFFPIDTTFYVHPTRGPEWLPWLYHKLRSLDIARLGAGSTVPGVNRHTIYAQLCAVPPYELVERFARRIQVWRNRVRLCHSEAATLTETRRALLTALMSGDVRVPDGRTVQNIEQRNLAESSNR
ncbi:MAG: restriction endonuclease subunit S, partial [Myxococcota bacterium]